ncbi:MAG: response regulator [Candidatus Omnitrophica bacterium]|nr:response regulator [Candidatus Omnitrophota bacterium]
MPPTQTVLVADDDPDLRDILRSILEPEGFRVVEAADGQKALDSIRTLNPDLLILDFVMPRLDGPHVCAALRKDLLLRHVPVIMLTGRGEIQDKVQGIDAGADDYLVKPFEPQELLARVRMILRRTTEELEANPLTRLPGNVSIQREIEERLAKQQPMAVCYADLNRFKAFNDHYGFERGDQAIRLTARILLEAMKRSGNTTDFLGHIGGDDFMIVTTPDKAEAVCEAIIKDFDEAAPGLYDDTDRAQGFFLHTDRQGQPIEVKCLSIAIGIVTNVDRPLTHLGQIAAIGAELKAYAKQFEKSLYVKERRKNP